jgi:hypothetical protein
MGRQVARLGGALPVFVCALVAHVAGYRSLVPSDGVHGYLGWYELLVAVLSVVALLVLAVALVRALLGRRDRWLRAISRRPDGSRLGGRLAMLAAASMGLLAVQEALEQSLGAGRLQAPELSATTWLVALGAVCVLGVAILLMERSLAELIDAALAEVPLRLPSSALAWPRVAPLRRRRRNALAERRGLRAPPLLAG